MDLVFGDVDDLNRLWQDIQGDLQKLLTDLEAIDDLRSLETVDVNAEELDTQIPLMPAIAIAAFNEIATGSNPLRSLKLSASDIVNHAFFQGFVTNGQTGAVEFKTYRAVEGTDAETDSHSIVHPSNFDADTNPYIFVIS